MPVVLAVTRQALDQRWTELPAVQFVSHVCHSSALPSYGHQAGSRLENLARADKLGMLASHHQCASGQSMVSTKPAQGKDHIATP